jgi:hypothetical protein
MRWCDFNSKFDDCDDVTILWSDDGDGEWVTVYVAVTTEDIVERLIDGWDGSA